MITHAALVDGTSAHSIAIEVEPNRGVSLDIRGLSEHAARETRIRVLAALCTSDLDRPNDAVVTLSACDRRGAPHLDLAIAVALHASVTPELNRRLSDVLLVGELGLSGALRWSRGLLPQLLRARAKGLGSAIVPVAQLPEAQLVEGLEVYGAQTLLEVVEFLRAERLLPAARQADPPRVRARQLPPIRGLEQAKRAMRVAAAGQHSVLLIGPLASGKTMLARRLPSMCPRPNEAEVLDIATCRSAAGLEFTGSTARPFRAPHHTASSVALLGGAYPVRPGEVTLAHAGVLLLDELPEFQRGVAEQVLRVARDGQVIIHRRGASVRMPAQALVVGAMAPCPCGRRGDAIGRCACSPEVIAAYFARVPLHLFDMHVLLGPAGPLTTSPVDEERTYQLAKTVARVEGRARPTASDLAEARRYRRG